VRRERAQDAQAHTEQQIGDAAVPHRQILLEPRYLFHTENPHFGIDGEVEEFGTNGRATGLRDKVQLKSTGEANLARALRTHIELTTADYWRAQDLPCLVVGRRPNQTDLVALRRGRRVYSLSCSNRQFAVYLQWSQPVSNRRPPACKETSAVSRFIAICWEFSG
jgi:hypothetical protein